MKEDRKDMLEIVTEIEEENNIDLETARDLFMQALSSLGGDYNGKYHFWLDQNGYVEGDATEEEIKMDMEDMGVESLDEILNILDQDFIAAYKEACKEKEKKTIDERVTYTGKLSELKKTEGKISSCDIVIAEYDDAKGEYEVFSEEPGWGSHHGLVLWSSNMMSNETISFQKIEEMVTEHIKIH